MKKGQLCVSASPNSPFVVIDGIDYEKITFRKRTEGEVVYRDEINHGIVYHNRTQYFFPDVQQKYYLSEELSLEIPLDRVVEKTRRYYRKIISSKRKEIDKVLGEIYIVIPHYKNCSVTDLILLVRRLKGESREVLLAEISEKLKQSV